MIVTVSPTVPREGLHDERGGCEGLVATPKEEMLFTCDSTVSKKSMHAIN